MQGEVSVLEVAQRALAPISDLDALRSRGDRPALISGDELLTYTDLIERVDDRIAELGAVRSLVRIGGGNDIDTVVTYLAALCGDHVVHVGAADPGVDTEVDLHPDLAVVMSTSGSTGSPKLVRLSRANVDANAVAIADYLELRSDDRAITTLPLHYCYGLSIVASHLAVGGSVVLTDTSVVDACFWDLVDRWRVTSIAGVPHTFDLLDRLDGAPLARSSLRRVTQAGGRLDPARVRHHVELGQRCGWDFVVMYGQTEATARMAYLPADLAIEHPASIGRPIPGGRFELAPVAADLVPTQWRHEAAAGGVGELVYEGPNVMMGYAECPADLARGHDVERLYTGDLGRRTPEGLYEIIGRRSRFIKLFGHRIDLAEVERWLAAHGVTAAATGDDDQLAVAMVVDELDANVVERRLSDWLTLPAAAVRVVAVDELPRCANDKIDHAAIADLVSTTTSTDDRSDAVDNRDTVTTDSSVAAVFAAVLGVDSVGSADTFTSLGGDSLSYVEASIRLERLLGPLPTGWHVSPVGELEARTRSTPPTGWRRHLDHVETSVVIRAVGILIIVATHMRVMRLAGGAHTLLAVAGYNFARFQLTSTDVPRRLRRGLSTVARVAVPTTVWIGMQMAVVGGYSVGALFLVNNYFGSPWRRDGRWEYWYFEAFVQIFLVLTLLFSIGAVRRTERRAPFGVAFAGLLVAIALGLRFVEFGDSYNAIFRPHTVLLFVMFGWTAQKATSAAQRGVVSMLLVISAALYFDRWQQAVMVIGLIGLLVWLPNLAVPRRLVGPIGVIAAASMYIFLVHWQVWPMLTPWLSVEAAYVATIAVGIGVAAAVQGGLRRFGARHSS